MDRIARRNEVLLLLGVSLGMSAIYSMLSLIRKLTEPVALSEQAVRMNESITPDRPWLDLAYQLAGIAFGVVPALLCIHLINRDPGNAPTVLGLAPRRWGFDLGGGALLALAIGVPGLALYFGAKALGLNATVEPANLGDVWWSVPILILAAAQNAFLEEIVVVGYLMTRLTEMGWRVPVVIATSAILRGSYHLYQGFGGFVGNLVMGIVFALVFLRWRRTGPLVVAHTLLDVVAFVGYALLADRLHWI